MMPKELGGVVSPELLVYGEEVPLAHFDSQCLAEILGTTNIRVADASIVPMSVFPHTTLGLYGVAEKAADIILKAATR